MLANLHKIGKVFYCICFLKLLILLPVAHTTHKHAYAMLIDCKAFPKPKGLGRWPEFNREICLIFKKYSKVWVDWPKPWCTMVSVHLQVLSLFGLTDPNLVVQWPRTPLHGSWIGILQSSNDPQRQGWGEAHQPRHEPNTSKIWNQLSRTKVHQWLIAPMIWSLPVKTRWRWTTTLPNAYWTPHPIS